MQLVTDSANGLIVDVAVSTQPSDVAHLASALERVEAVTGKLPGEIIAAGDCTNRKSIIEAADKGVAFHKTPDRAPESPRPPQPLRREDSLTASGCPELL